jgi:quercetin dioxygenase-like cupin family protein
MVQMNEVKHLDSITHSVDTNEILRLRLQNDTDEARRRKRFGQALSRHRPLEIRHSFDGNHRLLRQDGNHRGAFSRRTRKERVVHTVDLNAMELMEGWFAGDPSVRFRANFAVFGGNGSENSAAVYIVMQPGEALGEHTDSAEEVLLVVDGMVEMTVGKERSRAGKGTLAVVPAMVPHGIRNVGAGVARVVGFFPSPGVVATFAEPVQPIDQQVMVFGDAEASEPAMLGAEAAS